MDILIELGTDNVKHIDQHFNAFEDLVIVCCQVVVEESNLTGITRDMSIIVKLQAA